MAVVFHEEHGAEVADERGEEAEGVVDDAVIAAGGAVGENDEVVVAGDDDHSIGHRMVVCVFAQQDQTVPTYGLSHHNVAQTAGGGHGDAEVDVIDDGEEGRFLGLLMVFPLPASRACLLVLPHPVKNGYVAPFTIVKIEIVAAKTR